MRESIATILDIQELDVKMIRLMRLKKQRLDELKEIDNVRKELAEQIVEKEARIKELDSECTLYEQKIEEHQEKIKKLESQQSSIKKIDEFNALTKEITTLEREKASFEQTLSNLVDEKGTEEELHEKTKETQVQSEENSKKLEEEIKETILQINQEGAVFLEKREEVAKKADPALLVVYERLLKNKSDRVVVPIENRICSGCHIALTAQHENLVRKGEKVIFCEHCSRIHYWPDAALAAEEAGEAKTTKRRRRRSTTS